MKDIVFVIGNYKNGGVPMRSTNLANAFAEKGYHCTILVTKEIAENVFFNKHQNVQIVSLNDYISEHKNSSAVKRLLQKNDLKIRFFKFFRYFTKSIKSIDGTLDLRIRELRKSRDISVFMAEHKDSIYIAFGISYFEKVFLAAKNFGCKTIYAERNAPELEYPTDTKRKNYLISMVSEAAGAVLQTNDELKFFGDSLKQYTVINNPVKSDLPERFTGYRRNVVVNFCRIAKQKNIPLMIDAFMLLHKDFPDFRLEIYGNTVADNEEALKADYINYVKEKGAEAFISFLPPRADVHNAIKDAMMFVSSSDFEGLSNSMIEAMAIGLPCVCTDCLGGGAREMITDGENGLLVPMNDVEQLYLAMKRMITDNSLREKCSLNAYKIRDQLTVEKISQKWLDFIDSVT